MTKTRKILIFKKKYSSGYVWASPVWIDNETKKQLIMEIEVPCTWDSIQISNYVRLFFES